MDHRLVKGVLHKRTRVGNAEKTLPVRLIFGKKQVPAIGLVRRIQQKEKIAERRVIRHDPPIQAAAQFGTHRRLLRQVPPRPRIAKPERRQEVKPRRIGPPVRRGDLDQNIVRPALRIFNLHVEIAVLGKSLRIGDFKLALQIRAMAIGLHQLPVGIGPLRIFIKRPLIRMGRHRIEIKVGLLHILPVIALRIRQPEKPFLEDRIGPVPQGRRKTETALAIRKPEQTVLAPAIGPAPRVIVRQIIPTVPARRIILANRPPLPLGQIGPPPLPILLATIILRQPQRLRAIVHPATLIGRLHPDNIYFSPFPPASGSHHRLGGGVAPAT